MREIIVLTTSNLSSANAFNLDQAKILSFGKVLITLSKTGRFADDWSTGYCNTIWSAYTLYRHLEQYCAHPKRLTLSQMTNFTLFQIERLCRWQFQIWWKWQKVLQNGRKHCGKRRNGLLWAISPFLTVFSIDLYCRHVKNRACLEKGRNDSMKKNLPLIWNKPFRKRRKCRLVSFSPFLTVFFL